MNKEFNQEEQKLIDLFKKAKQSFLLTPEEKAILKMKITDEVADFGSFVTKTSPKRYKWWIYKLNIRGVAMPFIPIIIAILFAGGAGTVALADTAKPGDVLYGLDRAVERIQEKLTTNEEGRFNLGLQNAHERLEELRIIHELPPSERKEVLKTRAIEHVQFSLEKIDNKIEAVNERITSFEDTSERIIEKVVERSEKTIERLELLKEKKEELIGKIETDEVSPISPQMQIRLRAIKELTPQIREEVREKVMELRKEYPVEESAIRKSLPFIGKGILRRIRGNQGGGQNILDAPDVVSDVLPYEDYFDQGNINSQSGTGQTVIPQVQAQTQPDIYLDM